MSMTHSLFGERLKILRIESNKTQKQIANIFYISEGQVSRWEAGKCEPDILTIVAIAEYFNVTTDYLLGLED